VSAAIVSNILLAIQVCLVIWHLYLITKYEMLRKKSTSQPIARDNNAFSDDLKLDEKYHAIVGKKKPSTLRKQVVRSDVELWEQEKADSSKK
jgi:hypothetical protein